MVGERKRLTARQMSWRGITLFEEKPKKTVKWQCLKCGHIWDGVAPDHRKRRLKGCRKCGSWQIYPGWSDKTWKQVSAIVRKQRGYTCERCGAKSVRLATHHIISPWHGGTSRPDNLIVLCVDCHWRRHNPLQAMIYDLDSVVTKVGRQVAQWLREWWGRRE